MECFHRLGELGVDVPGVGGVDFRLEFTHFLHERVEVGVRIGHEFADLVEAFELGFDIADALFDVAEDGLVFVQRRLLLEDSHGVAGAELRLAVGGLVQAGHDLQDR